MGSRVIVGLLQLQLIPVLLTTTDGWDGKSPKTPQMPKDLTSIQINEPTVYEAHANYKLEPVAHLLRG